MSFDPLGMLRAVRDSDLSLNERIVIVMLTSRANDRGQAHPSLQRIADDCGMSRRSAIRAIADLESKGWVRCARRRANNQHTASVYTVLRPRALVPESHHGGDHETLRVVSVSHHGGDTASPPLVPESHQGSAYESPRVVPDSHRGSDRESPKLPNELPIQLPSEDQGDEQSRQAAQPAPSDAELIWLKLSQGTKRKLTPQRESAIAQTARDRRRGDQLPRRRQGEDRQGLDGSTHQRRAVEDLRALGARAVRLRSEAPELTEG